jgi:hypothetical protein
MRDEYRAAVIHLNRHEKYGHKQTIVVDNVVAHEHPLRIAGFAIGAMSAGGAQALAERVLRNAGERLAKLWGISR